jgi:hypothetical protein
MTSFAYPPTMAGHSFDPYSQETSYSDYPQSSQAYPVTSSYMDGGYSVALTSVDSYPPFQAEMSRSQDPFNYLDSSLSGIKPSLNTYSPAATEAEQTMPPRLSASSESGASAQSTSSSAMGSPHLHPQFPQHQEPWNPLEPSQGLGLNSQEIFTREPFFSSGMDQEAIMIADKIPGFVGESPASSSTPRSGFSFALSSSTLSPVVAAQSSPSSNSFSMNHSRQLPSPPILKSQTEATMLRSGETFYHSPRDNDGFKSPGVPASAMIPSSRLSSPIAAFRDRQRSYTPSDHSRSRRNSLLSNQLYPPIATTIPPSDRSGSLSISPDSSSPHFLTHGGFSSAPSYSSCRFPVFDTSRITSNEQRLTCHVIIDPSILNPYGLPFNYPDQASATSPQMFEQPPSPAASHTSSRSHHGIIKPSPQQSPYLQTQHYHPYAYPTGRRPSTSSLHSGHSHSSQRSNSFELTEEDREKGMCPIPECGRVFKDLKAHMLTHQTERPEKCPIQTCDYHVKGFARKYDKNRHTLTHYKGTMVCGFCPGSGSAAEKSFNRADVFKRHLTSVHGVEQTAPNSRRKSPISGKKQMSAGQNTSTGTCSTCSITFANAQEFYEHLDDCVLRVVQQIDPAEDINQKNLASVAEDQGVKDTLDRHYLPSNSDYSPDFNEEEEEEEEDFIENDDANDTTYGSRNARSGKGTIKGRKNAS